MSESIQEAHKQSAWKNETIARKRTTWATRWEVVGTRRAAKESKKREARVPASPYHTDKSEKGRIEDILAYGAEEGRGTLRKALVRGVHPQEPEISEWGNPMGLELHHSARRGNPGN